MINNDTRVIDLTVGQLQEILNENLESRISTVEYKVDDQGRRIDGVENDLKCVKQDCTTEKVTLAELKVLIQTAMQDNKDTMKLLKWVVIVAIAVIGAVAGVKLVLPGA